MIPDSASHTISSMKLVVGDVVKHAERDAIGEGLQAGRFSGDRHSVGPACRWREGEALNVACRGEPVGAGRGPISQCGAVGGR